MSPEQLLERLWQLLSAEAEARGDTVDRLVLDPGETVEAVECGQTGVLAFIRGYALCGWEDWDKRHAARDAYRALGVKLARDGFTLHMVHHRNVKSIILTRKLGAKFLGYDDNGYIHYRLTHDDYLAAQRRHKH